MTLKDLVDKASYCIRMMRLARWMAAEIRDDHRRRIVGRMVLVFVPQYVDVAYMLLRRPGLTPAQVGRLRRKVRALRSDYDRYHSRIRDDLGAHRDDLELDVLIDAWNEIDSDTLGWFVTAAEESFAEIVAAHPNLGGAVRPWEAETDQQIASRLHGGDATGDGARFSTDALALTRGELSIIPGHPVQVRMSVLVSVRDTLEHCVALLNRVGDDIGCQFLLKSMAVMDAVNLIEGVYGDEVGASEQRSPSLLEILEAGDFAGGPALRRSVDHIDRDALKLIRGVRNRARAHLDGQLTLRQIFDALAELNLNHVIGRVINPTWEAVGEACAADRTTSWLLLPATRLEGLSAASTPGVRQFDRGSGHEG